MSLTVLEQLIAWCAVINLTVLSVWFLLFMLAHEKLYQLHHRWFQFTPEQFDSLHYLGMMLFKLAIILFNIAPYFALKLL